MVGKRQENQGNKAVCAACPLGEEGGRFSDPISGKFWFGSDADAPPGKNHENHTKTNATGQSDLSLARTGYLMPGTPATHAPLHAPFCPPPAHR